LSTIHFKIPVGQCESSNRYWARLLHSEVYLNTSGLILKTHTFCFSPEGREIFAPNNRGYACYSCDSSCQFMNTIPSIMQQRSLVRWRIAAMVGAFAFVSYLQRMNISVAAEQMMPDLGLTKIQMGDFQQFSDRICDLSAPSRQARRFDRTETDVGSWSVALGCHHILHRDWAEAATSPVGSGAIRNWTPPGERALGNAFMIAGCWSSAAVTSPLVSWLMLRGGWRSAFYVTSIFAFGLQRCGIWRRRNIRVSIAELARRN
jgi:Major Facilitator Superfamily